MSLNIGMTVFALGVEIGQAIIPFAQGEGQRFGDGQECKRDTRHILVAKAEFDVLGRRSVLT